MEDCTQVQSHAAMATILCNEMFAILAVCNNTLAFSPANPSLLRHGFLGNHHFCTFLYYKAKLLCVCGVWCVCVCVCVCVVCVWCVCVCVKMCNQVISVFHYQLKHSSSNPISFLQSDKLGLLKYDTTVINNK